MTENDLMEQEWADGRAFAINAYTEKTGRKYIPSDEITVFHKDELRNTSYQKPYFTLEEFKRDRCKYDEETNDWLVDLVTKILIADDIPPIYLDELPDGTYALPDGSHRLTAIFLSDHVLVKAYLNGATNP